MATATFDEENLKKLLRSALVEALIEHLPVFCGRELEYLASGS
jgi:hypothetical protein